MRLRTLVLTLAVSLLTSTVVSAQETVRDPQGLQLLLQTFAALGGAKKSTVADLRFEGTLASPSSPDETMGTITGKVRGRDFSIDTVRGGVRTSYRVLNGVGSFRSGDKVKRLPNSNTQGLALDYFPLFARWTEFTEAKVKVSRPEVAKLDDVPTLLVRVDSDDKAEAEASQNEHGKAEVLIHPSTGVVIAIRYKATQGPYPTDQVQIENRFADYRDFGGMTFPTRITRYIDGKPILVIRVNLVQFNNGLSDADFRN